MIATDCLMATDFDADLLMAANFDRGPGGTAGRVHLSALSQPRSNRRRFAAAAAAYGAWTMGVDRVG